MRRIIFPFLTVLCLMNAGIANAAYIVAKSEVFSMLNFGSRTEIVEENFIYIQGKIISKDLDNFKLISNRFSNATVMLSGDGGEILPAIEIGKIIRERGFDTSMQSPIGCVSACALIWLSGKSRSVSENGLIGFHAAYLNKGGRREESGVANALIGRYMTLLNYSQKAIIFATSASPEKMLWLNSENKEAAGIEFKSMSGPPPIETEVPSSRSAEASSRTAQARPSGPELPRPINPATNSAFSAPRNWEWSDGPDAPWVPVATGSSGFKILLNQETFKTYKYSSMSGWQFMAKMISGVSENTKYKTSYMLIQGVCDRQMGRIVKLWRYDSAGKMLHSSEDYSYESNKLETFPPQSASHIIHQAVCN